MSWEAIFPFEAPRPFQSAFTNDMIASLEKGCSLSIAPNGFGKTACALVAGLSGKYDKVYYTTRTHKQAENVINTLKLINNARGSIVSTGIELSGKERSCIARESSFSPSPAITSTCSSFKKGEFCKHADDEASWLRVFTRKSAAAIETGPVLTASDILQVAARLNACPYYLSTSIHPRFKVIACSYNHVFDPVVRTSLGLRLENSLVICDEAHNIIDAMEGYLTRKLSTTMIKEAGKFPLSYSPQASEVFKKLEHLLSRCDVFFKTARPGAFIKVKDIMPFLDDAGITRKWLMFAMLKLKEDDDGTGFLADIIAFLHVLATDSEKDAYFQSTKTHLGKERVLKVSSMDVTPLITTMIDEGARIAFMSGTLSPGFFQKRLAVSMDVHEYNLPRRNLAVFISDAIPGYYKKLSSYYNERGDDGILRGFGEYLSTIIPFVPGGSIAFFPSYDFMGTVIDAWEHAGFIDYNTTSRCFVAGKEMIPLFIEDRNDKQKRSISSYKEAAGTGKALLLSIFRGGASEGEDFPGNLCRAVFCMGFPVRNVQSGETTFKMKYYDSKKKGNGLFWLNWDAMNAVSQAIGRGIRDPVNDKAIAVLLDTRYNKQQYSSLLCKWIRECIVMNGAGISIKKITNHVSSFF